MSGDELCVDCSEPGSGVRLLGSDSVWRHYCLWCLPWMPGNPGWSAAEFYTRYRPEPAPSGYRAFFARRAHGGA